MKYKYILIDLDDTIFDFIECEKVALINTLKSFGYNLNTDKTKIFSSINEKYFNKYANKNMTRDEFHKKRFEEFFNSIGVLYDPIEADKIYVKELSEGISFVPYAKEFILKLKSKYKIYIASNGQYEVQVNRLKKANIYNLFEDVFVSSVCGFNKPYKEFFDYIFSSIKDYDKSKYLMIGDREDADIIGGINAGIDTLYFNRLNKKIKYNPTYIIDNLEDFDINILEKKK